MSPKRKKTQKKAKRTKKYLPAPSIPNPLFIGYFDGSCGPINPGGIAAYGAVVYWERVGIWSDSAVVQPEPGREHETSNNLAEYCGVIAVLEYLIGIDAQRDPIMIYGDSRLVIQQMRGRRKIRNGIYVPYARYAQDLVEQFHTIDFGWIPRAQNTVADALSKSSGAARRVTGLRRFRS
jgi:ribonuclease HI